MADTSKLKDSAKRAAYRVAALATVAIGAWHFPWTAVAIGVTTIVLIVVAQALPKTPTKAFMQPTPSKRIAKAVTDEETVLWESRQHPISLWRWWLGTALTPAILVHITVATDVTWQIAAIVAAVGLTALSLRLCLWYIDRLCLTDKRVLTVTGILLKSDKMMPASKLTDLTVEIPRLSTILAWLRIIQKPYATFIVESAGQDQALSNIWYVPSGDDAKLLVVKLTT